MSIPARIRRYAGRHALVDGIPFLLPIECKNSPALFAVFRIDADRARACLPGNELFPVLLWKSALLVVSVMDYRDTTIGKYIEFSVAIACTMGQRPAPRLLPCLLPNFFGTGQFVVNLPVSTEISVKGGKGIWGMPKCRRSLDYRITQRNVSSQYDIDGQLGIRITIPRPAHTRIPVEVAANTYSAFRGMIWRSRIHFKSRAGLILAPKGVELAIGMHRDVAWLNELRINPDPVLCLFIPEANGILDDHCEAWFYSAQTPIERAPEGFESVAALGLDQVWPAAPTALGRCTQSSEAVR